MAYSTYYTEMLGLNRQIVAELFMVLAIMVLLDPLLSSRARMLLLTVFGLSLAVSHYGLLMIFVLSVVVSLIILALVSILFRQSRMNLLGVLMLAGGLLFMIALWFTDLANSYIAQIMFDALDSVIQGLMTLRGTESSAFFSIYNFGKLSILAKVGGLIYYVVLSLVVLALTHQVVMAREEERYEPEYLSLGFVFLMVMTVGAYNANVFGFISESRLLHISMIFLAPLAIYGGKVLGGGI
jgi:uncharacterized membrane protein